MKCADAGVMQMFVDGECGDEAGRQIIAHLGECAECRRLMEELSALDAWTRQTIENELFRHADKAKVDTDAAWQRFSLRLEQSAGGSLAQNRVWKRSWKDMNKKTKTWVTGASAAAVLAVSLSFPQVQAAASDFLSIFRMDKVQFVKLTQDDLAQTEAWLSRGEAGEMDLKGLGKLWIDESGKGEKDHRSYNSREAAEKAGVKLPTLPKELEVQGVDLNPSFTVHFEINVDKANKLLSQLQVDQKFDEKLSGKTFSLTVPNAQTIWLRANDKDLNYSIVDAPELKAPEGVDLEQLRSTILSLPFIPDNVKKQMLSIEDWQHTLPMPYVADKDSKLKEVKVNGADGILITNEHDNRVIWQQDGRIHMLEGYNGIKSDELLAFAKEM